MQYCSLWHRTLLPSPVISTTGYCFCFGSVSSFFWGYFSTLLQQHIGHLPTWGVHLSVLYLFAFSYCSLGSQGKNTDVACPSLLQCILGLCFPRTFPRQRFLLLGIPRSTDGRERTGKKTVNRVIKPVPILDKQIQSCWEHWSTITTEICLPGHPAAARNWSQSANCLLISCFRELPACLGQRQIMFLASEIKPQTIIPLFTVNDL